LVGILLCTRGVLLLFEIGGCKKKNSY